ncbi:MAG: ribonuclease III family protein [Candidatus Hydrothermarchaeaceae archaeon]
MATGRLGFARNADLAELSSIGDSFVNLIYSLAVSKTIGKPIGKRASNHVLSQSLLKSGLREKAGRRLDKGALADYVEAMIFQAWIKGEIELEECVSILSSHLTGEAEDPYKLRKSSIIAFAALLSEIARRRGD